MAKPPAPSSSPAAPSLPKASAPKADSHGRVFLTPGTVRGPRFVFDDGAIAAYEDATDTSALSLLDGSVTQPKVTHVLALIAAGASDPDNPDFTPKAVLTEYGTVPVYRAALEALEWGVRDLGMLSTGKESEGKSEPDETPPA